MVEFENAVPVNVPVETGFLRESVIDGNEDDEFILIKSTSGFEEEFIPAALTLLKVFVPSLKFPVLIELVGVPVVVPAVVEPEVVAVVVEPAVDEEVVPEVVPLVVPVEVAPAVVVPEVVVLVVPDVDVVVVPVVVVATGAGSSFFLLQETKIQVAEMKPILRNVKKSLFMSLI